MDTLLSARPRLARGWIIAVSGVLLLGSLVVWGLVRSMPASEQWIEVQAGAIEESITVASEVVPTRDRLVTTQNGGVVESLDASPGKLVEPGEVLLRLGNPGLLRDLAEAEADLATARAEAKAMEYDLADQIDDMRLSWDQALVDRDVAKARLEAEQKLWSLGISSRISLERYQAEFKKQSMVVDRALRKLRKLEASRNSRLQAKLGQVAASESRARSLRDARAALLVTAPFSGTYVAKDLKLGQSIAAGTVVAEIIGPEIELKLSIPGGYRDEVRSGQAVRLDGDVEAVITRIAPVTRDGMFEARARVETGSSSLVNGSTHDVTVAIRNHGSGTYIRFPGGSLAHHSVDAVVQDSDGERHRRSVVFGASYGDKVVVESGASGGELILGP